MNFILEVRDGFDEIEKAKLFYRETGELSYLEVEMEKGSETDPTFSVVVNEIEDITSGVEYYFEALDLNGKRINLPEIGPGQNPFRLMVEMKNKGSDQFVKLSPEDDLLADSEELIIAVSCFAIADQIESLNLFYDGQDVTDQASLSGNMIVFKIDDPSPGDHSYYLSAKLTSGEEIKSEEWSSSINIKTFEMPLNITGKATVNTYLSSYNADSDTLSIKENDLRSNFLLDFKGNHNWFKFKSKLYFSSLERRNKQAVNRYNVELYVPHFGIIAGDSSPNYGNFSVIGKNIRGFHSKLFFKYFRLSASIGHSRRDTKGEMVVTGDSGYSNSTFKRNTKAMRMEIGSQRGFIWGLNVAQNRDDIDSLEEEYYLVGDSLELVLPNDNLVIGTDTRLALFDQRFVWGAEAAMSLYNSNIIDGPLSLDSLEADYDIDDFPIDPEAWENLFILNENVEPIMPGMANLAYKTYFRAFFARNLLNVSYSAIGSSFNSLTANYLQNDSQIISIYDNINLMHNELSINLGVNLISDNLNGDKDYTTSSTNYFGQILYRPLDLPYFRFSMNNNNSKNDFDTADTTAGDYSVDIGSSNFTVGTGYKVKNIDFAPTDFSISYNNSNNKDTAHESYEYKKNNITFGARSEFADLPLNTVLSYSFTTNDNSTFMTVDSTFVEKSNYNSIYMKGILSLLEGKLKPFVDFRFSFFGGDTDSQSSQMFNLGTGYKFDKLTFLSTDIGMKTYQNNDMDNSNYSKLVWRFKVSRKF